MSSSWSRTKRCCRRRASSSVSRLCPGKPLASIAPDDGTLAFRWYLQPAPRARNHGAPERERERKRAGWGQRGWRLKAWWSLTVLNAHAQLHLRHKAGFPRECSAVELTRERGAPLLLLRSPSTSRTILPQSKKMRLRFPRTTKKKGKETYLHRGSYT